MRLDHVSYVASHDQISDVVQRIGSQIGTAFVDGGIHPQFGTRNFTAPLLNGQYIEVVCALDHPAAEKTAFGQAVSRKADEGGGWLTWVFSTEDIVPIETALDRIAIDGHRRHPDGTDLKWKQIGVKELLSEPELPFFVQWLTGAHPSLNGNPAAKISKIIFSGTNPFFSSIFSSELESALSLSKISTVLEENEEGAGIFAIEFSTRLGMVLIQ